jgi:hypothetical protein
LRRCAREKVIGLGQNAGELRVVLLDVAHGGIDLCADVLGFRAVEQIIEPRLGRQVEDALGVIGGGFIQPRAAPSGCARLFQLGALDGKADFGKAQKDEAEDGRGVFLGFEAGVGAELVGSVPEAFFQHGVGGVFF